MLLDHPNEWLGAEAMVYLSHACSKDVVGILLDGLQSANPAKRGSACEQAGERNIRELKHEVGKLLNDPDDYVRRAAQISLEFFDIVWAD